MRHKTIKCKHVNSSTDIVALMRLLHHSPSLYNSQYKPSIPPDLFHIVCDFHLLEIKSCKAHTKCGAEITFSYQALENQENECSTFFGVRSDNDSYHDCYSVVCRCCYTCTSFSLLFVVPAFH